MIMEILVSGLLVLLAFRSGMEYQKYKATKESIEELQRKTEALKEDKPEANKERG